MASVTTFHTENDGFHVHGQHGSFEHSDSRHLINLCKSKLPRKQLPIYIGNTGYVEWRTDEIPVGEYCWDLDQSGRIIVMLGDMWFFQRFIPGDFLMTTPIYNSTGRCSWNLMSEDKIGQLTTMVENFM